MKNTLNETKEHYKSYKAGKHWLYACLTVTTLGLGLLSSPANAQADTSTDTSSDTDAATAQVDPTANAQPAATATLKNTSQTTDDVTPTPATTPDTPTQTTTGDATSTETEPVKQDEPASQPSTQPTTSTPTTTTTPAATPDQAPVTSSPDPVTDPETQPAATPTTTTTTEPTESTEPVETPAPQPAARASRMMASPQVAALTDAVDPTTDPNNAVNWMPDPVMRQWIEDTLTGNHTVLVNGVPQGTFVTDENLYQFVNDQFLLSNGNYQSQPGLKSLQGLERFTGLTGFDVTDIDLPLSGMINFDFAPNLTTFRINNTSAANLDWNTSLTDFLTTYLGQNTKLHFLSLDNVGLTGDLNGLVNYPDLWMVTLTHNQLTGTLPDFAQLPNLYRLTLNHNQLSGTLPDFATAPGLTSLDIANNNFTGNLPNAGNLSYWAYAQNHFTSGLYHPQDGTYFQYEGWNQALTTPDYTQSQAQAGFDPFTDAHVTSVQDTVTGENLAVKIGTLKFENLHPTSMFYSPTAPENLKDYADWAAWADQQTDVRSWFRFTLSSTGEYKLTPLQALPGGYYVFRVAAYAGEASHYNFSAFITSKIEEGAASTITVKNVDQAGNVLGQQVLNGKVGDRITVTADDLANYKLISTTQTVNKVFTDTPQTITFVYASTLGTVTVKELAPDGTVLDQRTMTGTIDDAFTAEAGHHYGYTLVGDATVTGTYTEAPQTITFNYTNTKGTVTVKNVDTNGHVLSQKSLTGNVGAAFTVNADQLDGYTLTSDPTATGTYTEDPQTVTFVYAVAQGTVTIKNVDTAGNVLSQSTLTGNVGDTFTANADTTLAGYQVTGPATQTGTYTTAPQTITFTFTKITTGGGGDIDTPTTNGTVIVKNVDANGNVLSQHLLTGKVGDTFTANADTLAGYRVTGAATQTGTYATEPQTVTFVFEPVTTPDANGQGDQVAPTPTKPTEPTKPTHPTTGAQPATAQPATGQQAATVARPTTGQATPAPLATTSQPIADRTVTPPTTELPQTDEHASVNPLVAGLTLLLATLGLGLKRKRNH